MSLSWNEPIRTSLSPDRVGLVRMERGRRFAEGRIVECAAPQAGEKSWARAVDALKDGLEAMNGQGSRVTVVLSNHFVRYVLVPWNAEIKLADEEQAYARHCFEQIYGTAAANWDIRLSNGDKGVARVACAVDADLPPALDQAVAETGRKLSSLKPYLMVAFNLWRNELTGRNIWFVLAEKERLCLSTIQGGQWVAIQNQYAGGEGWHAELPALLARQRLLSGLDGGVDAYVNSPDETIENGLLQTGAEVHDLRLAAPPGMENAQLADLEMARCG